MSVWTESVKRGWANPVGPEATRAITTIALGSAVVGLGGPSRGCPRQRRRLGSGPLRAVVRLVLLSEAADGTRRGIALARARRRRIGPPFRGLRLAGERAAAAPGQLMQP
jgi:hypothetical protein